MKLAPSDRAQFVTSYTKALVTCWSDEAFSAKLSTDPRSALADVGVELPARSSVRIIRPGPPGDGSGTGGVDDQVALFERGLDTGSFEFYVPDAPRLTTTELNAGELQGVAGGGIWDPYCCSCCPSCCSATGTP